mgnify:CR=1 FL=1
MKFDFYTTLKNHSLKNAKGKVIASYADFSSCFGRDFSEPLLLHSLMTDIFADKVDAIYTGDQLKDLGVVAEPDLYMRIGDSLYLFEYKDVTLSDEVKFSADSDKMKKLSVIEYVNMMMGMQKKEQDNFILRWRIFFLREVWIKLTQM